MGVSTSTSGGRRRRAAGDGVRPSKLAKEATRSFQEMVASWPLRNLHCLLVELEASLALRELTAAADLARTPPDDLRSDLETLYRRSCCWDVCVEFDRRFYYLHRCVVQCRSGRLSALISGQNQSQPIALEIPKLHVNHELLDLFFQFLYTGSFGSRRNPSAEDLHNLNALVSFFGVTNTWSSDMESLCRTAQRDGDMEVMFTDGYNDDQLSASEYDDEPLSKWRLHAAILAARSPFFCSLIEKRRKDKDANSPLEVYFDESVIPRYYAPVIFKAIYRDTVDLSLVNQRAKRRRQCCLNEVKAIASGTCLQSPLEEAIELYQIGRFLEYPLLMHGCEEVIASKISFDTLRVLYSWAYEPHGSYYVSRCCVAFLAEHFAHMAARADFVQLDRSLLADALKLDFVQATELEILGAIIRWGENQLIRRLEEQEPNLITRISHSVSRRGLKRCDETDSLLAELLADLMKLVRVDYVLPRNHQILADALQRNLLIDAHVDRDCAAVMMSTWSCLNLAVAKPPRIYLPFYAIVKKALLKRMVSNPEEKESLIERKPVPWWRMAASSRGVDLINCCLNATATNGDGMNEIERQIVAIVRQQRTAQKAIACGCSYHLRAALDQLRLRVTRQR